MPVTTVAAAEHIAAFGMRLKNLRLKSGMTRKDLAERSGLSPYHLNKIERGASGPSFGAIHALAAALHIDPSVLFTPATEEQPGSPSWYAFQKQHKSWSELLPGIGFLYIQPGTGSVIMSGTLCQMLGINNHPDNISLELFIKAYVVSADRPILSFALNQLISGVYFSGREIRLQPAFQLQIPTVVHGTVWPESYSVTQSVCAVFVDVTNMEKTLRDSFTSQARYKSLMEKSRIQKEIKSDVNPEFHARRHAERHLQNIQNLLKGLIHYTRDALLILSPDLTVLEGNSEIMRYCGVQCDYVADCGLKQIVDNETYGIIKNMAKQAMTAGKHIQQEIFTDGQALECRIYPVYDVLEKPYRLLLWIRDTTEIKQQHESLYRQSLLLQKAEQVARVGSWEWDVQDNVFRMSPNWFMIHGMVPKEMTTQELFSLAYPADLPLIQECFKQALEGESEYRIEHRIIRKDSGEVRWVDARGELVRNEKGEALAIYGVSQDVTEIRHSWQKQAQDHRHLQQMLEYALAGYWDWNIQKDTVYLSPMLKKLFGYEDHELDNKPDTWKGLIFPEDLPLAIKACQEHTASRGVRPYEVRVRYRHRDGSTVWVLCTGAVVEWDEQGNPLRMIGCHVDITKRV